MTRTSLIINQESFQLYITIQNSSISIVKLLKGASETTKLYQDIQEVQKPGLECLQMHFF